MTLCPMCQLNLDAYQEAVNKRFGTNYQIPILYFTQLMGLAFGMSEESLGIGLEFIPAGPALAKISDQPTARKARPRAAKGGLPMPALSKEG